MTPAQRSILQAFVVYAEQNGKDDAHDLLVEIGDDLSLWPAEVQHKDLSKLCASLLVKGMTSVACNQRGQFLREMMGQVSQSLRVIEGGRAAA